MTPTRFIAPVPVPTEPYEDRLFRIVKMLRLAHKHEERAFVLEQAATIVRVARERDDLLFDPETVDDGDVKTDAEAIAFITRVSNGWKH